METAGWGLGFRAQWDLGFRDSIGIMRFILGLCRDNGKYNGSYYIITRYILGHTYIYI